VRDAAHSPVARVAGPAVDLAWLAAVHALSCAALAAGTYNPFIYFRF
jgi:hypothetical protein